MGRRLRYDYDSSGCDVTVQLTATRGAIRLSLALLRELQRKISATHICVNWELSGARTMLPVSHLTTWPADAVFRLAWKTWVGLESATDRSSDGEYIVVRCPNLERQATEVAGSLPCKILLPEICGFPEWSTRDRPHLWPKYALYAGREGQLILYTMGGLAHGRFKLAKRQLDDFLALEDKAPLHLGFRDTAQGVDASIPIAEIRLPLPKNADRSEPYYVIDLASALRCNGQPSLAL